MTSSSKDPVDLATCPIMELHNHRRLDEGRSLKLNLADPIYSEEAISSQRVFPAKQTQDMNKYLLDR
jgi:hypothetical protein